MRIVQDMFRRVEDEVVVEESGAVGVVTVL